MKEVNYYFDEALIKGKEVKNQMAYFHPGKHHMPQGHTLDSTLFNLLAFMNNLERTGTEIAKMHQTQIFRWVRIIMMMTLRKTPGKQMTGSGNQIPVPNQQRYVTLEKGKILLAQQSK